MHLPIHDVPANFSQANQHRMLCLPGSSSESLVSSHLLQDAPPRKKRAKRMYLASPCLIQESKIQEHPEHPTNSGEPSASIPLLQSHELAPLNRNEMVHCVNGRRPSECTRGSHQRAQWFPSPTVLASSQVWECARHHVVETLTRAHDGRSRPFLILLSDVVGDLEALSCEWERHIVSSQPAAFRAATPVTEGITVSLEKAWRGVGMYIQHDLDEEPSPHNPVIDFLRRRQYLKLSSMWFRVERWMEDRLGSIARRPAFITGLYSTATATHFDEYDSLAFVLKGAKTFYIAPPEQVKQSGRKMMHESTAHPYKPGTQREQRTAQPFERIDVPAGGLLFLPARWWHFVESAPNTLMICAWAESDR